MADSSSTAQIRECERIARLVKAVSEGVVAHEGDLLHDPYIVEGVLIAIRVLNLVPRPHAFTEQQAWEWCQSAGPVPERIWAGLGLLGQTCGDCHGCRCYDDCESRNDPDNYPEECGQ